MGDQLFDTHIWMNVVLQGSFDSMIALALTSYSMHMVIKALPTWTEWKYEISPMNPFALTRKHIRAAGFFNQPLYKQCLVLYNFSRTTLPMHRWRYLTQDEALLDLACRWVWYAYPYDAGNTLPYWCNRRTLISLTGVEPQEGTFVHSGYQTGLTDDLGMIIVEPRPIAAFMDEFALLIGSLVLVPVDYSRLPAVDDEVFWDLPDNPVKYLADEQAAKRQNRKKSKQTALIAKWEPTVAEHFMGMQPETAEEQHVVVDLADPLWVPLEKAPGIPLQRVCPISGREITIPARGKDCVHLDCFDLPGFIQHARQTGHWQCPLCTKSLRPPNTIVIDPTCLLEIL